MTERAAPDTSGRSPLAPLVVGAAALDLLVLAVLHVATSGVDVRHDPTSSYVHTGYGALVPLGQVAFGVATAATGVAWRRHPAPAAILLLIGVAKIGQAFFPLDQPGAATTAGAVHNVLGNLAFWLLPVAAVLLARPLARHGHRITAVVGVALVPAAALVLVGAAAGFFGWAQRLYLVLATCWILLTGRGRRGCCPRCSGTCRP